MDHDALNQISCMLIASGPLCSQPQSTQSLGCDSLQNAWPELLGGTSWWYFLVVLLGGTSWWYFLVVLLGGTSWWYFLMVLPLSII